jgi:crotonobetainyl-CoA:carnitine CoA-transferase CaiB-like acyl-CoA transferase
MTSPLLKGVRVIDLSRTVAAPSAAQMLGDFGAEVIKVERPGAGDEGRAMGPTFLKDRDGRPTGEGSMFLVANRNKRGITADLSTAGGQGIIRDLVAVSDVLIENYKVGDMSKFGLDYGALRQVNPGLIYCSVTGYGQTGPYSSRPGYDPIFQAMGGWMSLNGPSDDRPTLVASNPVDTVTGYHAALAVLAALYHRDRNGGAGQFIDVALLDVAIAAYSHRALDYLLTEEQPARRGTRGQIYPCSDGKVLIALANKGQWVRFCKVIDREDIAYDPRYDNHPGRLKNGAELYPQLEAATSTRTLAELSLALDQADIPFSPIYDYPGLFNDPQVIERKMAVEITHPLSGKMRMVANPIKFSSTPIEEYSAPPLLGEHQEEILSGLLGMSAEEIAALREQGAI